MRDYDRSWASRFQSQEAFLRAASDRKGKSGDYYNTLITLLIERPRITSIESESGNLAEFVEIAESFVIRHNGDIAFHIMSNGKLAAPKHADLGWKPDCTYSWFPGKEHVYRIPDYISYNTRPIATAPKVLPDWAWDLTLKGDIRQTKEGWGDFIDVLVKIIIKSLLDGFDRDFKGPDVLKFLFTNNTQIMDKPLSHFVVTPTKDEYSLPSACISFSAALEYFLYDFVTKENLLNHPFPTDPVWQISVREMVASYYADSALSQRNNK